jgi:hypothetical protein
MATLQNFDAEIAKTKQVVEDMRSKIEQSGTVLDKIAKSDTKIGACQFRHRERPHPGRAQAAEGDGRQHRRPDHRAGRRHQRVRLRIREHEELSPAGKSSLASSQASEQAQRMRTDRVRNMSLAGNLQELLVQVRHHRRHPEGTEEVLDQRYKTSEASLSQVIERRKTTMPTSKKPRSASRN